MGGLKLAEESDHRETVFEGRSGPARLERLVGGWGKENAVERESSRSRASHGQVTKMGRVKAATEEPNTHDG
jgi:hypothetical protein